MKVKKIEVMETGLAKYVGQHQIILTTTKGRKFRICVDLERIDDGNDSDAKNTG